ncbi:predicted protein [Nematostella vectensis]|uniref:MAPEG family protein n=1 Tax=Nematostella vectensis TaxID=45351 RepID=A7RGN0_NEMVE|nr:transmembrane protein 79 [Nematostella vectensis]EDO49563.1 predicted protein [Nematostella vectensis]|eukprot:XP_001641626.1 predicted protein [Nematostella vectensis]
MASDTNAKQKSSQRRLQSYVIVSIALGIIVLVTVAFIVKQSPPKIRALPTFVDRITFTLQWELVSLLAVQAGIVWVARTRFSTAAINPLDKSAKQFVEIPQKYLKNTVEQFVLHFVASLVLTTYLTAEQMFVVPVLVGIFVTGRLCFAVGYKIHFSARGFGFALTWLPTVAIIMYCLYRMIQG